ncbi:MAG: 6-phosphofructokinase [Candidatus Eisenbacteria bacterium]|nr:6-phosphofructokinase [Candidatus Eisenbacteria bacterium]
MRIAILTGGGDCPGLNAVIRAVVRRTVQSHKGEVYGISDGWAGMVEGRLMPLDLKAVSGILPKGGTMLGTSRTNPFKIPGGVDRIMENIRKFGVDALIAVGGEDTLGVAARLHDMGVKVVGVPKTIDNDLSGTEYTFGFDTAINVATDAIDRLHTTAESHNRVMVVEVMGRHAGWIAVESGIAGGADVVLIPEMPISVEEVCNHLKKRHERGKNFSIVVVAEGARFQDKDQVRTIVQDEKVDAFGHVRLGGIGAILAQAIEERTGYESRYTVLGHIQRGGTPSAFDRVLGTRFGVAAADLAVKGEYGKMVGLRGNKIEAVWLKEAVGKLKTVDMELYEIASVFFG